jgi:arylsulfatase A-like enzyme
LAARGALAGALGGLTAGAVDFGLAAAQASAFLPSGRARLLVFLCALYGAAFAALGALVGLAAAGFQRTDLGALWRNAFGGEEEREGARWAAYGIATLGCALAIGFAVRAIALDALGRYHARVLIAALVGGAGAGLAAGAAIAIFVLAKILSPLVPFGPRARIGVQSPTVMGAGWALGLMSGAGAIAFLMLRLQAARSTHPLRASSVGLWAPVLLVATLAACHLLARVAGRKLRLPRAPLHFTLAFVLALALPMVAGAAANWATVRQLDRRALVAALDALSVALMVMFLDGGRALDRLRKPARALFAIGLPALLLALALSTGKSDRVRKAAVSFTGLTNPLVQALHAATDLDRDGYSSVLGGGDCDDFDRDVHPGAFDWPDDGIDQDCNGHQATLAGREARTWATVPDNVPQSPNVVLLTIDALRADHVGSYGYQRPTTPNLDALAKEAVRFERGWAHAPSTRYSVPAILTGRYPSTIAVGSSWWPPNLLPENRMIAEMMKELGYTTGAFLSYYYFDRRWGLDQGFDDYDIHLQTLHSMGGDPAATNGSSSRQLADLDIDWITKHKGEKFFLWSHYYDTHFRFERHPDMPDTDFGPDEPALYDGEIRFTDAQIGRVFAALKDAGLWDKTIVIVTSDHGDGFGEHGLPPSQRHGYHLYANETKVPILIRIPGVAPRVVEEPVGHVDLIPTLLNALRRPAGVEPQLLGDSVLDLMLGAHRPRHVFQEVWYEGNVSRKAVADAGWHFIRNVTPDGTRELYDLAKDPQEEHDVSDSGLAAEEQLDGALGGWMDQIALPKDFEKRVAGNLSTQPIAFQNALGDRIGDSIEVAGSDVAPTARVGGDLELSVILHMLRKPPDGWRLFMHVIGANGQRLNADHEPMEGFYPLTRARPGQWIRDRVHIALPRNWPPGPTLVEMGLWRGPARQPTHGAHSGADSVRVATVEVAP